MFDRIVIACVAVAGLSAGAVYGYKHVKHLGYEEAKAEFAEASRIAIEKHKEETEVILKQREVINESTVAKLQQENAEKDKQYRAAIARSNGLRVSKAVCSSGSGQATSESSTGNNEAESVRLPENVERSLYDLVRKADEVNAQLSACQGWIRANKMD